MLVVEMALDTAKSDNCVRIERNDKAVYHDRKREAHDEGYWHSLISEIGDVTKILEKHNR